MSFLALENLSDVLLGYTVSLKRVIEHFASSISPGLSQLQQHYSPNTVCGIVSILYKAECLTVLETFQQYSLHYIVLYLVKEFFKIS